MKGSPHGNVNFMLAGNLTRRVAVFFLTSHRRSHQLRARGRFVAQDHSETSSGENFLSLKNTINYECPTSPNGFAGEVTDAPIRARRVEPERKLSAARRRLPSGPRHWKRSHGPPSNFRWRQPYFAQGAKTRRSGDCPSAKTMRLVEEITVDRCPAVYPANSEGNASTRSRDSCAPSRGPEGHERVGRATIGKRTGSFAVRPRRIQAWQER